MKEQIWEEIRKDPENPEIRKVFERTLLHIIKEAQATYEQLEGWIFSQDSFTDKDLEALREIDTFTEKIHHILLQDLITSKNFGGIPVDSALIEGSKAQELMKKNGWRVVDIQGQYYSMNRKELLELVTEIVEAADQNLQEIKGFRLVRASQGLLALKENSSGS